MANEFNAVSDGVFTLTETQERDQFIFCRNDGEVLGEVGRAPMDLYQAYIMKKMMDGAIPPEIVMKNVHTIEAVDGKSILMTVSDMSEEASSRVSKKPNFLKHFFQKMFG